METSLIITLATGLVGTATGAFAKELFKAVRGAKAVAAPKVPGLSASNQAILDDSLDRMNKRITEGFRDLNRRMDEGFGRVENAIQSHLEVDFPALERRVGRIDVTLSTHTGREHEDLEGRVYKLEAGARVAAGPATSRMDAA